MSRQVEFAFGRPPLRERFADGAFHLRGFALPFVPRLLPGIADVAAAAPFRHMRTPGGQRMSAALTNCGAVGWCSDRRGYRYESRDPESGRSWPAMPGAFVELAQAAAAVGGYADFRPDACLINRYEIGAGMGAHRDADEQDFSQPIVSVSLGLPMTFRFGSPTRGGRTLGIPLAHGDVLVWGGPSRLCYHSVSPLKPGSHPQLGPRRINLTFRVACTAPGSRRRSSSDSAQKPTT